MSFEDDDVDVVVAAAGFGAADEEEDELLGSPEVKLFAKFSHIFSTLVRCGLLASGYWPLLVGSVSYRPFSGRVRRGACWPVLTPSSSRDSSINNEKVDLLSRSDSSI